MPPATRISRRREVEVLRALAIVLVVVHHLGTGRVSGGVDVFFVLSGLLLTLSLVHRVDHGETWSFRQTVTARFARLLPSMAVVLVSVLAAAVALVPPVRWPGLLRQTVASVGFFQNELLAAEAIDYYASNRASAPILQHMWSMAITGQFYVLWPLLFAGVLAVARRTGRRVVPILAVALGLVLAGSLTASVLVTEADPARAYFLTVPRLWEFAAGSLLALVLHRGAGRRPGGAVRSVLAPVASWVGVVALVACGFLQPTPAHFPGLLSWWPVGAALLIIAAGDVSRFGMAAVLDNPVTRWISAHAYSLFLWHWPVLVLWQQQVERSWATITDAVAVLLITVVLTWLGERAIAGGVAVLPGRRIAVLGVALAVVLVPVAAWQGALIQERQNVAAQSARDNPGAGALRPGYVDATTPGSRLLPYDASLENEWANLSERCDLPETTDPLVAENCREHRPDARPTRTVVVLGDSRSQQWTAALQPVAEKYGWRVLAVTLHQCTYTGHRADFSDVCNDFNAAALAWVLRVDPDAVVSVATRTSADPATPEAVEPGYRAGIQSFLDAGIQVVGMRDTPRFDFDVPECVQRHGPESPRCQVAREQVLAPVSPLTTLPEHERWAPVDLTSRICPDVTCPPVVGNVYVYMDIQHLSRTYAASMADDVDRAWFRATGWSRR